MLRNAILCGKQQNIYETKSYIVVVGKSPLPQWTVPRNQKEMTVPNKHCVSANIKLCSTLSSEYDDTYSWSYFMLQPYELEKWLFVM
jgi:hypothetical protein